MKTVCGDVLLLQGPMLAKLPGIEDLTETKKFSGSSDENQFPATSGKIIKKLVISRENEGSG